MSDEDLSSNIKWAAMSSVFFWSTLLQKVTFGEQEIQLSVQNAIYSSAVHEIEVPQSDYLKLINAFEKDRSCTDYDGLKICDCESEDDASYPILKF